MRTCLVSAFRMSRTSRADHPPTWPASPCGRLHPDEDFEWTKIARQLAGKREACRRYLSRRRARPSRGRESFYAAYDPITRTIYADGMPCTPGGAAALLDAVLSIDRGRGEVPPAFPGPSATSQAGARRRRPRGRG
jgi:hypothetical protein